jgi:hypothetical protein
MGWQCGEIFALPKPTNRRRYTDKSTTVSKITATITAKATGVRSSFIGTLAKTLDDLRQPSPSVAVKGLNLSEQKGSS